MRAAVRQGEFLAAVLLPLGLVLGSVLAGGGLLMVSFVLVALPLMLVLALPPFLGRWVGRMLATDDVPAVYAVITVALWLVVLPLGFLMTAAVPAPVELEPDGELAAVLTPICLGAAGVLWVAQLVVATLGVRLVRPHRDDAVVGPAEDR